MGKMSRDKGKRYERELASKLREYGYDARRTSQYCGNTGDASDVVGLPGIHIEAKHQERIQIYEWISQATHDSAKSGNKPAVFFRKNNSETLVCMKFDDWIELYREWESTYEENSSS
jgi:Holliday junction resolvase